MFVHVGSCRWPLAVALCLAAFLFALSPNFRWQSGPRKGPYAGDFLQEWIGGYIVRASDRGRLYDLDYAYRLQHDPSLVGCVWDEDQYLPIVYPPFYYLLVSPLSLVSVRCAAWVWAMLMLGALVASWWILQTTLPSNDRITKLAPWMLPAWLLFMPVLESLSSSQKGTLCLLLFTSTFALWRKGQNFWAGVAFGLLAFKPQLTLVIALAALWKRDWRFVAGGLATGLALLALSLAVGVQPCLDFLQFACGSGDYMQNSGYDLWKSHTVWGFGRMLAPGHPAIASSLSLILLGVIVWSLVRLLSGRWEPTSERFCWQMAGLTMATLLVSPHLFTYDLTILLLPMAIVLGMSQGIFTKHAELARSGQILTAILFMIPAVSVSVAAQTGWQITVPLMVAYLAWCSHACRQASRKANELTTRAAASIAHARST
jgi:hypothetical protein